MGMISVNNTYNTSLGNADEAVNLPDYAGDTYDKETKKHSYVWENEFTSKFSQFIVEASINVEF